MAEGKGVEPSSPSQRTALAERPGDPVSGYLPQGDRRELDPLVPGSRPGPALGWVRSQWTHRELNPDLQHAELVSSRWTMSPFSPSPQARLRACGCAAEGEGVEPSRHRCSAVFETA